MLRIHFCAPQRTVTAAELARSVGYPHHSFANSQYGRLGRLIGEQLDFNPTKERVGSLATFEWRDRQWHWIMRPEVANALEQLGWVDGNQVLLPEEVSAKVLVEGAIFRVSVNAYERNPEARRVCLSHHGRKCCICRFDFGEVYGAAAEGYIHVHHLRPLSETGGEYQVNPVEDLAPVCPNCHAVLHRKIPAYTLEEVRKMLREGRA